MRMDHVMIYGRSGQHKRFYDIVDKLSDEGLFYYLSQHRVYNSFMTGDSLSLQS